MAERKETELSRVRRLIDRSKNFGDFKFDVRNLKCHKCGKIFNGLLFLDRKNFTVTDTWEFMLFSEGVTCDDCVGSKY